VTRRPTFWPKIVRGAREEQPRPCRHFAQRFRPFTVICQAVSLIDDKEVDSAAGAKLRAVLVQALVRDNRDAVPRRPRGHQLLQMDGHGEVRRLFREARDVEIEGSASQPARKLGIPIGDPANASRRKEWASRSGLSWVACAIGVTKRSSVQVRWAYHEHAREYARADEGLHRCDGLQRLPQAWLVGEQATAAVDGGKNPAHPRYLVGLEHLSATRTPREGGVGSAEDSPTPGRDERQG
jgi:hypothetical protein